MYRDNRTRIKKACTDFDRSVREALYIFNNEVVTMREEEEEKLERLPSQLRDSSKGEQIDDSIAQLSDVLDKLEDVSASLDDIADSFEVKSEFIAPAKAKKANISTGRKGKSFHALFPESLLKELRDESLRRGISMNEFVCRVLHDELENSQT